MTIEAFNEIHGPDWVKFKNRPIFTALKAVIAAHSPAKLNAKAPPLDTIQGGAILFAQNQGYEVLVDILETKLGAPKRVNDASESDYSEPEV